VVILSARKVDAVVFDMDGVITDSAVVHRAAWKAMFDRYLADVEARTGKPQEPFSDEDYLQYVDGKHRDDGVSSFLAARGIALPYGGLDDEPGSPTVWGLANRKNAAFQQVLARNGVKAFPSSVTLVRSLQEHGVGTAIISASRNCQAILESAGIGELFPVRVDGVETARLGLPGKPSPAVFLEAARQLGAAPGRSVVVEDAIAGVEAGRAGGFGLVIGVDRVGQADQLRAHGADTVVTDLGELQVLP
jgi:alpha,alpha-trehalase